MSLKTRTVAVLTGAAMATTLVAAAATATPSNDDWRAHMGDQPPAHMADMDAGTLAEMGTMMADNASMGEMHQWMGEQDLSVDRMHRDMAQAGMPHGRTHQMPGSPDR